MWVTVEVAQTQKSYPSIILKWTSRVWTHMSASEILVTRLTAWPLYLHLLLSCQSYAHEYLLPGRKECTQIPFKKYEKLSLPDYECI
jgi:hypothetical protein